MRNKHEPIEWLEKARLDFYEETKGMDWQEIKAMIDNDVRRVEDEFGFKFRRAGAAPSRA